MSISVVADMISSSATISIPTHQAGDLIVISARGTSAVPSIPAAGGTVPAWVAIQGAVANSVALRTVAFVATSSGHTSGTFTSATHMVCTVFRSSSGTLSIGASSTQNANNTQTIVYPALTLTKTDGTSMGFRIGTRGTAVASVNTPPPSWTMRSAPGSPPPMASFSRASLVANPIAEQVTLTGAANSAYRAHTVEIIENPPPASPPTYTATYDDFDRADGPVYSGVELWEQTRLDWSTLTAARVISNRLGLSVSAYEQALSKQALGPGDFDIYADCAVTPGAPNEIAFWFNMTNTGDQSATMAGYVLVIAGTTWSVRKYVNGANTGNIGGPTTAPGVIANDQVWIAKRGNTYTIYRNRAAAGWYAILSFTDVSSPSGKFAIEMSDATVRWDNVRGGPFAPPVPLDETLIDDFNRADARIHEGAGADRWTGRSASVDQISGTVSAPNIRSNQMASIAGQNYYSTSKFMLARDFDLLIDLPVVGTTYVDKLVLEFCETGLGANSYTGYRLEVQNVASPWKLTKHYDMGGGTYVWSMIVNSTAPIVADGDSVWIRKRNTKISILRRPSGGVWASVLEATDSLYNTPGYITVSAHSDNAGRFDNLRGGPIYVPPRSVMVI